MGYTYVIVRCGERPVQDVHHVTRAGWVDAVGHWENESLWAKAHEEDKQARGPGFAHGNNLPDTAWVEGDVEAPVDGALTGKALSREGLEWGVSSGEKGERVC